MAGDSRLCSNPSVRVCLLILQREKLHGRCQYLFIETICNDPETLERNYGNKMLYSPDYAGMDEAVALADFKERIRKYEEVS